MIWERQAKASIEASCASRGIPRPKMVLIESMADVKSVLRAAQGPRDKPFAVTESKQTLLAFDEWPETLVIDSITDACAMMRAELHKEAPPKKDAVSGLSDESYAHRRHLSDRCAMLIRMFRNAPMHVVFLALEDEQKIYRQRKEVGQRYVPQLPAKDLPGTLMAATNAFGYMFRGKDGRWGTMFEGSPGYALKTFPPLRRFESADVSEWIARIRGSWQGTPTQAPVANEDLEEPPYEAPEGSEAARTEGPGESGEFDREPAPDVPQNSKRAPKRAGRPRRPAEEKPANG